MRRISLTNSVLVLVGLGSLTLGGILLLPGPTLTGPDTISLPVGVESTISLRIQNQSTSTLQIARVETSCGCLSVAAFPETVAPFWDGVIELTSTPLKSQWGETQTVQVVLTSGRVLVTSCTIIPEPIWPNFPEPIKPELADSGEYLIRLNTAYASVIDRVEFDTGGTEWLLGVSASTIVSAQAGPIDPIAYDRCFSSSNCGISNCGGGNMCNCCSRRVNGILFHICKDGSCLVA